MAFLGGTMNQLNETLRILRTQIAVEEMKPSPDLKVLKKLRKEEVPMGKMNNLSLELEELRKNTNKLSEILSTVSDIITTINDIVGTIESAFSSSPETPKKDKKSVTYTLDEAEDLMRGLVDMLNTTRWGDENNVY